MSRGAVVRFLLVLGLLAGCAAIALGVKPNLGLDLRSGAQFVFQASDTETTSQLDSLSVRQGEADTGPGPTPLIGTGDTGYRRRPTGDQ